MHGSVCSRVSRGSVRVIYMGAIFCVCDFRVWCTVLCVHGCAPTQTQDAQEAHESAPHEWLHSAVRVCVCVCVCVRVCHPAALVASVTASKCSCRRKQNSAQLHLLISSTATWLRIRMCTPAALTLITPAEPASPPHTHARMLACM